METQLYRTQFLQAAGKTGFGPPVVYQPIKLRAFSFALILVVTLLFATIVWVPINDIESVKGSLQLEGGSAAVLSPRRGVITQILVEEGQFVRQGDALAKVSSIEYDEYGGSSVQSQLEMLDQQLSAIAAQRRLIRAGEAAESALNESIVEVLERELESLLNQQGVYVDKLALAEKNLARDEALLAQDMLPLATVERSSDAVMSAKILLQDGELKIDSKKKSLLETKARLELSPIQRQQESLKMENEELRLRSRKRELMDQSSFSLIAQRDGFIDNLFVKIGAQLDPRNPVMNILSPANSFEAQLYAYSSGVVDLKLGQIVRISIDSLPSEKYGHFSGVIQSISQESIQLKGGANSSSNNEEVYVLSVSLSRQDFPSSVFTKLRSGMQLTAEVTTGRRTMLDRLVEPLQSWGGRL